MNIITIWDLPLRLFHWSLAVAVSGAMITGQIGGNLMPWHGYLGQAVVALVAFRLVWGVVGSTTARFTYFLAGPTTIRAYLRGRWLGVGHNPLGALSVLAMLGLALAQALTGLFANDDIAFQGPLYSLVGSELSGSLTGVHKALFPALLAIVVLHLAAIVFYTRIKGENLVRPMITGRKESPHGRSTRGGGPLALLLALALAALALWGASGAWLPPPPPPPPASEAPSW